MVIGRDTNRRSMSIFSNVLKVHITSPYINIHTTQNRRDITPTNIVLKTAITEMHAGG